MHENGSPFHPASMLQRRRASPTRPYLSGFWPVLSPNEESFDAFVSPQSLLRPDALRNYTAEVVACWRGGGGVGWVGEGMAWRDVISLTGSMIKVRRMYIFLSWSSKQYGIFVQYKTSPFRQGFLASRGWVTSHWPWNARWYKTCRSYVNDNVNAKTRTFPLEIRCFAIVFQIGPLKLWIYLADSIKLC